MTEKPYEIPDNWVWCRLDEVSNILDNQRTPINSDERKMRIQGKSVDNLYPYYGATGQVGYIDNYIFDGEFVLLGEDGAPFLDKYAPKAYIIMGKSWVNNHAHILQSKIITDYLCHALNKVDYSQYVFGTTRLKLTQADMRKIAIPLPPLAEQSRIVTTVDLEPVCMKLSNFFE